MYGHSAIFVPFYGYGGLGLPDGKIFILKITEEKIYLWEVKKFLKKQGV